MRVLDIDLDFFLQRISYHTPNRETRLDPAEYPPWELEEVVRFLEEDCRLPGRLPGVALEHHADLFYWWRERIEEGRLTTPFSVTHVDAHADLGMGDDGHVFLMTELLHKGVEQRSVDPAIDDHLTDGNFLLYAVACQWLRDLTYVRNESFGDPVPWFPSQRTGPTDIPSHVMKNGDPDSDALQLHAVDPNEFARKHSRAAPVDFDPEIPFKYLHRLDYQAEAPFDVVCLVRSPSYTPEASDELYEAIRNRFIDEAAWD